MNSETNRGNDDELTWPEVRGWLEQGAWTMIVLFPFLYWINGPAVSTDQWVMRLVLVIGAAVTALSLTAIRLHKRFWSRR